MKKHRKVLSAFLVALMIAANAAPAFASDAGEPAVEQTAGTPAGTEETDVSKGENDIVEVTEGQDETDGDAGTDEPVDIYDAPADASGEDEDGLEETADETTEIIDDEEDDGGAETGGGSEGDPDGAGEAGDEPEESESGGGENAEAPAENMSLSADSVVEANAGTYRCTVGGFIWSYDIVNTDDACIEDVARSGGTTGAITELNIPSELDGHKVVMVSAHQNAVTRNNNNLKSVTFPDTIESLLESQFSGCDNLESVYIKGSLTDVRTSCFYGCKSLKTVVLPETVTYIGSSAFKFCYSLKTIHLPSNLKTLGQGAFMDCTALESIELPDTLETVGASTFLGCTGLKEVKLSARMQSTTQYMFKNCTGIEKIDIPEGVGIIDSNTFEGCSALEEIKLPSTVTEIKGGAFWNSTKPEAGIELDLSNVTKLGTTAFSGCAGIKSVKFGNLSTVDTSTFRNCTGLESLVFESANSVSIKDAFTGCTGLKRIDLALGENAYASISSKAFDGCASLESVCFGGDGREISGNTTIQQNAFSGCSALKDIYCYFPDAKNSNQIYAGAFGDNTTVTLHGHPGSRVNLYALAYGLPFEPLENDRVSVWFFVKESRAGVINLNDYEHQTIVNKENKISFWAAQNSPYALEGWYTDKDFTHKWNFDEPVTESMVLYAKWVTAENVTVTYETNGGSAYGPVTVAKYGILSEPSVSKSGFYVEGWYENSDFTGRPWNFTNDQVLRDMTLYAKWAGGYIVTFNAQNNTPLTYQNVPNGSPATRPADPVRNGYDFIGWSDNGNGNLWNFNEIITRDMTLYGEWREKARYTVTFNSNGGSSVPNQTVIEGEPARKPTDPTKSNAKFVAWYSDSALTQEWNFNSPVTSDKTLYAKWINIYTVTFNSNGGSAVPSQEVESGQMATVPTVSIYDGHTFEGWYTDSNFATLYNFSTPVTANITLYAKWRSDEGGGGGESGGPSGDPTQYTVSFYTDGGSHIDPQRVTSGQNATKPEDPEKVGCVFGGWYSDSSCATAYGFSTPVTGNITLYAKWIPAYTVTFEPNGGGAVEPQTLIENSKVTKPGDPERAGYTFDGWYREKALATAWDFNNDTIIGSITLYAKWNPNSNTVVFESNGGGKINSITVLSGEKIPKPADPARSGFVFCGWYDDEELKSHWNFDTAIISGKTLYAKWIPSTTAESGLWIEGVEPAYTYTGAAIKPTVRVYSGDTLLTAKTDYTVSYSNNTKVNDASNKSNAPAVTIKGKGNFSGSQKAIFRIDKVNIKTNPQITVDDICLAHNGKEQKPVPVVRYNGKALKNKTNFKIVEYLDPGDHENPFKDPGTYKIKITGSGSFCDEREVEYTILEENLIPMSKVSVGKISNKKYSNGNAIEPKLTVKNGKTTLVADTNYTVEFVNNKNVGTATAILTGKGKYVGTKTATFKITGAALNSVANVTGITNKVYNGSAQQQSAFVVKLKKAPKTTLVNGKDYTVSYSDNTKAGTATIVLTGKGAYTGTLKKTFKITAYNIGNTQIKYDQSVKYMKGGAKPKMTITFGGRTLTAGTDYTVAYSNNGAVAPSTAKKAPTITIKGKGCFNGSVKKTFTITSKALGDGDVTMTANDIAFVNKAGKYVSKPVLTDADGKTLKSGTDYTTEYFIAADDGDKKLGSKDSVQWAGDWVTIKVKATGKGAYGLDPGTSTLETTYRLTKNSISDAKIKIADQKYTGSPIILTKPDPENPDGYIAQDVTVKVNGIELNYGTDYVIDENSYSGNIKKGTASVILRGVNDYGGTKKATFKMTAKGFSGSWDLPSLIQELSDNFSFV